MSVSTPRARHWVATAWGPPDSWEFVEHDVPAPETGEVRIRVRAAGVNPADAKHVAAARPGAELPVPIGYEISGEVSAIGADTRIGSGAVDIGDEVIAFRVRGGYATEITVPAEKVFAKPSTLTHPEAANLLLVGHDPPRRCSPSPVRRRGRRSFSMALPALSG